MHRATSLFLSCSLLLAVTHLGHATKFEKPINNEGAAKGGKGATPLHIQSDLAGPDFVLPESDPKGVWKRIQDKLWKDVFSSDKHHVCPDEFQDSQVTVDGQDIITCRCIPKEFAAPFTHPKQICVTYENVRCGSLARKAWRAVFHDFGTHDAFLEEWGANGSLEFELDNDKNAGTELGQILKKYRDILESEVDALGRTPIIGHAKGMADIIVLGGTLALYSCGHPGFMFSAGRVDAEYPDPANLPSADDSPVVMFDKFKRMGLNKHEIVILMAAGHTIAGGIEGAWFDNTPTKFDADWFGATLASVGSSFAHKFSPAPFTAATDAHLVNDAESRSIMIDHATADDKKAKFLEEFEKVFFKGVYWGQSRCVAAKKLREAHEL